MPDDFSIVSLRGGINNSDPPSSIDDDQCVDAENVEHYYSMLGERRRGCTPVTLSADLIANSVIVHASQWFPTNNATIPEWFIIGAIPGTSLTIAKRLFSTWTTISPKDNIDPTIPDLFHITSRALGTLLFFAYRSSQNRLHVWDGTHFRRTGFAQPVAPTFADHGSGSYASTRYARVRFIEMNVSSRILRRSEPSASLVVSPSGSGDGVTITMPALLGENETHWEIELSTDDATFYPVATQAVAATTYLDTVAFASGYVGVNNGLVSEEIGTYLNIPSVKYMITDGDRLIGGGHWTDPSLQSSVFITPVSGDPGAGNSERLPLIVNNTRDLDGYGGGALTGLASASYGTWFAFKWSRIYIATRTTDVTNPYDIKLFDDFRGALPGSVVKGADRAGGACTYFIDPRMGPSRLGNEGLQLIVGIDRTWKRINTLADIPCRAEYYADKQQVWWWIAIDGSTYPNYVLKLQVSSTISSGGVVKRGWTVATGRITNAYCTAVLTEQIFENGNQVLSNRPYVGLLAPDLLQRCDTGITDAGVPYVAGFVTKPYILAGIANKWGARAAAILVTAVAGASVVVRLSRNFGVENSAGHTVYCSPAGSETQIVDTFDDSTLSEATSIQLIVRDT